jgi:hypothetical protein
MWRCKNGIKHNKCAEDEVTKYWYTIKNVYSEKVLKMGYIKNSVEQEVTDIGLGWDV